MTTAEGQRDDFGGDDTPANKYDGLQPRSDVDGNTSQDVKAGLRIRQGWQQGTGAPPSSGFALGPNRPD
jgi:hypothetical protein